MKWQPVKAHRFGSIVRRDDGQLGYAKRDQIENEKLAADLGQLVDVTVPPVDICDVEKIGKCDISHIHSCKSRALAEKDSGNTQPDFPATALNQALKQASGLLPFLAWIAAYDHFDDTNLVVDDLGGEALQVRAIDFEHAFDFKADVCELPAPPKLRVQVDQSILNATLAKIEQVTEAQILTCCETAFGKCTKCTEIAKVLSRRARSLREKMQEHGLLG